MPDEVVAMVLLEPASGRSLAGAEITAETLPEFAPDPGDVAYVTRTLAEAGFGVGPLVGIAVSASAPRATFERFFGVPVHDAEDAGWVAGAERRRELPVPEVLAGRVHAVTFEPPAEAVVLP